MSRRPARHTLAVTVAALASCVTVVAPSAAGRVDAAALGGSSAFVAVQPCRLVDTRQSLGVDPVDALTLQVATRGRCGVPAEATSVSMTLTAVAPSASGFLTAWPADHPRPTSSNVNFSARQVRANGAIVPLDAQGAFRVFTSVPSPVVVDVIGAFVPVTSARSGRFVAMPPQRTFDSRLSGMVGAGTVISLPLPGGVPADAVAIAANVTITQSLSPGYVSAAPGGRPMPEASILNVDGPDQTRAAAGILPVSATGLSLLTSGGGHLVVDVLGYFTGASTPAGTDGLFTAYDPTRLLDTRGTSPLGNGIPLYPAGGVELPVGRGGAIAVNVTSVVGDPGYVTAFAAGTATPPTSTVNSTGTGDVANFAIIQVSDRGITLYSQSRTHALVDLEGWFSGPSATATLPPPANIAPVATLPSNVETFSACTDGGAVPLQELNAKRSAVGAAPITARTEVQAYACAYALHLAEVGTGSLIHSNEAARDAALGCASGEIIAYSSGTSIQLILDAWFASAPHVANIKNSMWRTVGIAFVTRTQPNGDIVTFGVTDFAIC